MPQHLIRIGDRLSRKSRPQYYFPKSLFKNRIDSRPPMISAIEGAIVEGLSDGGYWVRSSIGEVFHVSHFSIGVGDWSKVV